MNGLPPVPDGAPAEPAAAGEARPMTPVTPQVPPAADRDARRRWLIAGLATIVVVALMGALVVFVGGGPGSTALGPRYLPAATVAYAELRTDLPGDQAQALGTLLAKLPGFKDTATLPQKLADTFDHVVGALPGGLDYSGDIAPWFGGQLAVGLLPEAAGSAAAPTAGGAPNASPDWRAWLVGLAPGGLLVAAVADPAKARAFLDGRGLGSPATYGGATLWRLPATPDGLTPAVALTTDALLVGSSEAAVRASVDIGAGRAASLAAAADFTAALKGLRGDRLGTLYLARGLPGDALHAPAGSAAPTGVASPAACAAAAAGMALPGPLAGELHAENADLVAELHLTLPAGASPPPARVSDLATHVPGSAAVYLETHALAAGAASFGALLGCVAGPAGAAQFRQLEGALGSGPAGSFGWAGDAALAMTVSGGQPDGGLVVAVADAAQANQALGSLGLLLRLAGALNGPLTVTQELHAGTTITLVTVDVAALGQAGGNVSGLGAIVGDQLRIAYALSGTIFVVGSGGFVRQVLDTTEATSLARVARYAAALDAAGAMATGGLYLDLGAVRGAAEPLALPAVTPEQRTTYEQTIKPYLEVFDRLVVSGHLDGDRLVARLILFTR